MRHPRLPNDIILNEILPRVPAEALHSWRFACKKWFHRLYRDPTFIHAQLAMSRPRHIPDVRCLACSFPLELEFIFDVITKTVTLLVHNDSSLSMSKILGLFPRPKTRILGTCNGLVLLKEKNNSSTLHVVNPATRQRVALPPCWLKYIGAEKGGFGYDPSGNKFKVVLFLEKFSECAVLTLGSRNAWREIEFPFETQSMTGPAVTVDGFIHFAYRKYPLPCSYDHVLSLDVGSETFQLRKLPSEALYLLRIGNLLAMVACSQSGRCLDIWMLEDGEKELWSKRYSIPEDASFQGAKLPKLYPIASCDNGEDLIFKEREGNRLFYCDEAGGNEFNEIKTTLLAKDILGGRGFSLSVPYHHVSTLLSPYDVIGKRVSLLA